MQQINVNPIKTLLVAVAVCLTFGVIAQEKSTPLEQVMEGLTVRNIGPAGMSGRVTCIAAHPLKATTLYAGSASGGLWVSENNGQNWSPLFQNEKWTARPGAGAVLRRHAGSTTALESCGAWWRRSSRSSSPFSSSRSARSSCC